MLYNGSQTIQLTNDTANDYYPQVSGNNVIWQGWDGNTWQIYEYNGSENLQVSQGTKDNQLPQISGDKIVWQGKETDTGDYEIFLATPSNTGSVINGTSGADNLVGTASNDTINGLAGNDTLNCGAGIDTLIGGTGNDIYVVNSTTDTITELVGEGTDTLQSSVTFSLAALTNIENLTLTGTAAIKGTGNTAKNRIVGNSADNTLNGGVGADTLTGGVGNDIFAFQFGQSLLSGRDRITDFAINTDKIDLLTQGGLAMAAPSNFTRAADSIATSLANLVTRVFADADGAIAGNQALGVNSAALVQVTSGAIAGTYLVINDITAGFQANNDLLVNITGFTGTLPTFGTIAVNSFFV